LKYSWIEGAFSVAKKKANTKGTNFECNCHDQNIAHPPDFRPYPLSNPSPAHLFGFLFPSVAGICKGTHWLGLGVGGTASICWGWCRCIGPPLYPILDFVVFFRLKPKSFNPLWFCFLLDYYTPWGGWEYINPRVPAAGASIFKDSTDRPAA